MNIGEAVASRILELCAQRGITVNKLAARAGVTQSTINNIISGASRNPTILTLYRLCRGLEIELVEFFADFDRIEFEENSGTERK